MFQAFVLKTYFFETSFQDQSHLYQNECKIQRLEESCPVTLYHCHFSTTITSVPSDLCNVSPPI